MDYQADYFTSAPLALRALKHCSPAIIFLDIALGGSDAIEVIRMLGQRGYRGVVQLMSGSNPAILEDVRRIGERHKLIMRPPLKKPFRIDAIRQGARRCADRSVAGRALAAPMRPRSAG